MTEELALTQHLTPAIEELRTVNEQLAVVLWMELEPLRFATDEAMARIRIAREHVEWCGASTDAVDRAYSRIELVARHNVQDLLYNPDERLSGWKRLVAGCKYVCRETASTLDLALAQIDAQHAADQKELRKAPYGKKRIESRMSRQQLVRNDVIELQQIDARQCQEVAERVAVCNLLICAAQCLESADSACATLNKALETLRQGRSEDAQVLAGVACEALIQSDEFVGLLAAEIEKVVQLLKSADDRVAYARRAQQAVSNTLEALFSALAAAN